MDVVRFAQHREIGAVVDDERNAEPPGELARPLVLGRLAIYEIAVLTQAVQDLIVKRASEADIRNQALQEGFLPMRQYGFMKVLDGEVTIEEVISVTTMDLKMVEV